MMRAEVTVQGQTERMPWAPVSGRVVCPRGSHDLPSAPTKSFPASPMYLMNYINDYLFFGFFFFNFCKRLSIFERQRETEHERERGRERGRHRIQSRLQALSTEPDAGFIPTNHEIMT